MLTRALRPTGIPRSLALQQSGGTASQLREISTNSAIHRGIRKSTLYPSYNRRLKLPSRPSVDSRKPESIPRSLRREGILPRRPNHAARQDVEDIEESTRQARERENERLARYKRGGRAVPRSSAAVSKYDRGPRHSDTRAKPRFLKAIIDGQTGDRRTFSAHDERESHEIQDDRYRGDRKPDVQSLGQQVGSRSEKLKADRRAQARPASFHGDRSDSLRDYPLWKKNLGGRDNELGDGPRSRSKDVETDRRSTERLSDSQRGQGVFAEEVSFRGNVYGSSDESHGEPFPPCFQARETFEILPNSHIASSGYERNLRFQRADAAATSQRPFRGSPTPLSIPYTTPASEFLYGASVVEAAFRARRRTLYKLYMYAGENRVRLDQDEDMKRLAKARNVGVVPMGEEGLRLMNKMSDGRPHNVSIYPS